MKVFAHAARFDRERDALSWALGIAAFEIRTARKRRERRREDALVAAGPAEASTQPPGPLDPSPNPEQAAIARSLEEAMDEALRGLPRSTRRRCAPTPRRAAAGGGARDLPQAGGARTRALAPQPRHRPRGERSMIQESPVRTPAARPAMRARTRCSSLGPGAPTSVDAWASACSRHRSVVPMAVLSFLACGRPAATVAGALALVVLVVTAVWRGQDAGRGARLGLLAGVPPLLLPVVVGATGHLCGADVCLLFPFACLAGGLIGGLALGVLGGRAKLGPTGIAIAGVAAGLAGSLGCIVAGAIGVVVLVLGLAGGLAPALALRQGVAGTSSRAVVPGVVTFRTRSGTSTKGNSSSNPVQDESPQGRASCRPSPVAVPARALPPASSRPRRVEGRTPPSGFGPPRAREPRPGPRRPAP